MNDLTWHCQIILQNYEECAAVADCLTTHVMNKVYHDWQGKAYPDQRKARIYVLSEFLKGYIEEITDAGNERGCYNQMTNEIICGALQEIDFRELAEDLIGDYSPRSPTEVAENEEFFETMGFADYDIDED